MRGVVDAVQCSTAHGSAGQRRRRRHVAVVRTRVSRRARAGLGQGLASAQERQASKVC